MRPNTVEFKRYRNRQDNYGHIVMYLSLVLLLISCVDDNFAGSVSKIVWLVSFVAISIINVGAALGVYIASAAIYSVRHYDGIGSVFQRPDNIALGRKKISGAINKTAITMKRAVNTEASGVFAPAVKFTPDRLTLPAIGNAELIAAPMLASPIATSS